MKIDFAFLLVSLSLITASARAQDLRTGDVIVEARDEEAAKQVARLHRMELRPLMPRARLFLLRGDRARLDRVLEALKDDQASGLLRSFGPDRLLPHRFHDVSIPPNDPRYGGQWYLDRIDIEDAWRVHAGSDATTIVVIDSGCDTGHPDLLPKLREGYDAIDDDDDPSPEPNTESNEHGTACAGLAAAATDNDEGIAGACPGCSLSCVRLLPADGLISESQDIAAFNFALESGAAVTSNSWGLVDGAPAPRYLRTAIETFMREARGGRGGVVVFAAGNDSRVIDDDEVGAIPGVINVGAINNFDEAAQFSNRGDSVLVTAPLGTLTTDIRGADGAGAGDYTSSFGGTSSAAPLVAGVAGLLLSYDDTLSAEDVYALIRDTARPAFFAVPDESGHDATYGYGIVDPAGALRRLAGIEPDAGVDGGVDGGADAADAGTPPRSDSGGCTVGGSSRSSTGSWVFFAIIACAFTRAGRLRAGASLASRALSIVLALAAASLGACTSRDAEASVGVSASALRPDSENTTEMPPHYDEDDVVESLASPQNRFRIHYTRAGAHAVPSADVDTSGVPDFVELVAQTYDAVLEHYVSLGYTPPLDDADVPGDNGGDSLFDVYLVDFGGGSDGAFRRELCDAERGCTGYMLQENDFYGYGYPSRQMAVRLLASHEFFHAIQAAYASAESAQGSVLSEGTAVWASDTFDGTLGDIQRFSSGYLERTDRSLGIDPIGAVAGFSYGSGLFFRAISDQFDAEAIRALWERVHAEHAEGWVVSLDHVLRTGYASSFEDAFVDFSRRNFYTDDYADGAQSYAFGAELPRPAEDELELPFRDDSVRMPAASARYYVAQDALPSSLRLGLPLLAGGYEALHVLVAHVRSDAIADVERIDASAQVTIDARQDDALFIALVDARASGETRRVRLCVSDAAGDDPCAAAGEDAGAHGADAGAGADASVEMPSGEGGGCAVSGERGDAGSGFVLAALGLLLVHARRRRACARSR